MIVYNEIMPISIVLARFWGSLIVILGVSTIGARFLARVVSYTEDRAITVSTGYLTFYWDSRQ